MSKSILVRATHVHLHLCNSLAPPYTIHIEKEERYKEEVEAAAQCICIVYVKIGPFYNLNNHTVCSEFVFSDYQGLFAIKAAPSASIPHVIFLYNPKTLAGLYKSYKNYNGSYSSRTSYPLIYCCAARLIMKKRKYAHITPVIYELHWLSLEFRIQYKLAVLAFRHFEGKLPTYLSAMFCSTNQLSHFDLLLKDY